MRTTCWKIHESGVDMDYVDNAQVQFREPPGRGRVRQIVYDRPLDQCT